MAIDQNMVSILMTEKSTTTVLVAGRQMAQVVLDVL